VLFVLWILSVFVAAFKPANDGFGSLGMFVLQSTLLFAALIWFFDVAWLSYLIIFLLILGFSTFFKHIADENKKGD